jgi:glycosyltransferase involved in cell wall biosynthesis
MINGPTGIAKEILDRAYKRLGIPAQHSITAQSADDEREELNIYDYLFASNSCVESSLRQAGMNDTRIIQTSFGWLPSRFPDAALPRQSSRSPFRALFVGTVGVRKGIPELFQAWEKSGVDGELVVVGDVESAIGAYVRKASKELRIRMVPFTTDMAKWYRECDIFVLPTLEEGGPQVTLEAAACGMPIVTTEMGSARLIADDDNGLVVKEGDVEGLANAISVLYKDELLRRRFGSKAAKDAENFVYKKVSMRRAEQLLQRLRYRS